MIWNYRSGESLRTVLLTALPICLALDPAGRAVHVATDDGAIHMIEFFGEKAIVGPHSAEDASTALQLGDPWATVPSEAGAPLCIALSYDGTTLLTGHGNGHLLRWNTTTEIAQPVEIASLNAAVTNIVPLSPLPKEKYTKAVTVVRPSQNDRRYTIQSQFTTDLYSNDTPSRFDRLLNGTGFPQDVLAEAVSALQAPGVTSEVDADLKQQNEELWQVIDEQRALQSDLMERYIALRNAQATDPAVSGGGH
jgi:pre-rRNA-processing protein IPI3